MVNNNLQLAVQAFQVGQLLEAEKLAEPFASGPQAEPMAMLLLGIIRLKSDRLDEGAEILEHALKQHPNMSDAANWLSFAHFQRGDYVTAESYAKRALAIQPNHPDALNNLGQALFHQKKFEDAINAYVSSAKANPSAAAFVNLGLAFIQNKNNNDAEISLKRAITLGGDSDVVRLALADIAFASRDTERALSNCKKAVELNTLSATAHAKMANAKWLLGDPEAILSIQKAVRLEPSNAEHLSSLGANYLSLGRMDEAKLVLKQSAELQPIQGAAYFYFLVQTSAPDGDEMAARAKSAFADPSLSIPDRSFLCFALAKDAERSGDFKGAMAFYDEGRKIDNQLFNSGRRFDSGQYRKNHLDIARVFTHSRLKELEGNPKAEIQPIFVLGMIRSGTTLVNQILSSHSKVRSAGEAGFFAHQRQMTEVDLMDGLRAPDLQILAERYAKRLLKIAGPSAYISDKMPGNYLSAGVLHAAFPHAKIIHVKRNPIDTCLSVWTTSNATPPVFAERKSDLVFAYRQYLELMEHWRKVIPAGVMLEVDYEELVSNQDAVVRRIIEFVGLAWEEACLRHELNRNSISTPSVWQARQPMYSSSVGRWKSYEPYLGAFAELLEE